MSGLPIERIDHYMTEKELTAEFGKNGWKQLQDAFFRDLCYGWISGLSHSGKGEGRPAEGKKESVAWLVMKQIQAIYREEGKLKDLPSQERLAQRQVVIRLLVDALFAYLKQKKEQIVVKGKLEAAFTYLLNQEKYLRVFLNDGDVPMDNNASERAIRGFCIGKKNWEVIDTINGAKTSAVIYSIAETAKANNLKPYEYFEHLLTVIPEHMEDTDRSFLEELLPWSPALPENIRK